MRSLSQRRARAELGDYGPLLGGFTNATWKDCVVDIEPDTTIVMYTDGVTDAVGPDGARYGTRRLYEMLGPCSGRSAAEVITTLREDLQAFQSGTHADDTAALVIRRLPAAAASLAADDDRVPVRVSQDGVRAGGPIE